MCIFNTYMFDITQPKLVHWTFSRKVKKKVKKMPWLHNSNVTTSLFNFYTSNLQIYFITVCKNSFGHGLGPKAPSFSFLLEEGWRISLLLCHTFISKSIYLKSDLMLIWLDSTWEAFLSRICFDTKDVEKHVCTFPAHLWHKNVHTLVSFIWHQ